MRRREGLETNSKTLVQEKQTYNKSKQWQISPAEVVLPLNHEQKITPRITSELFPITEIELIQWW